MTNALIFGRHACPNLAKFLPLFPAIFPPLSTCFHPRIRFNFNTSACVKLLAPWIWGKSAGKTEFEKTERGFVCAGQAFAGRQWAEQECSSCLVPKSTALRLDFRMDTAIDFGPPFTCRQLCFISVFKSTFNGRHLRWLVRLLVPLLLWTVTGFSLAIDAGHQQVLVYIRRYLPKLYNRRAAPFGGLSFWC
jgi:hypothetical protein